MATIIIITPPPENAEKSDSVDVQIEGDTLTLAQFDEAVAQLREKLRDL